MNEAGRGKGMKVIILLRVGVVGGGCSGLSYKMDFDNEVPNQWTRFLKIKVLRSFD